MSKPGTNKTLDLVDHIAISVQDIKQTVEWYKEKFNCTVDYLDETWAYLSFDNIRLALVVAEQHPPHLALAMDNIEQYGVVKTHRDGTRSLYIQDPAGNFVELMDKQSAQAGKKPKAAQS